MARSIRIKLPSRSHTPIGAQAGKQGAIQSPPIFPNGQTLEQTMKCIHKQKYAGYEAGG